MLKNRDARIGQGVRIAFLLAFVATHPYASFAADPPSLASQPANTWVKRSPLSDGPVSPSLGYEGACVWDSRQQLLVRYGGHNQGGGGEQGAEVWTYNLNTSQWTLKTPNSSPPGVCCNKQNVYDPTISRYIRFPKFSGSHGWQWWREIYMNDSSVWTYDLSGNRWRNMRPLPTPRLSPYRCASWDSDQQVVVVFGGEGSHEGTLIYDPHRNEWRWPKPKMEPAPRSGGSMAYDAARKLHILFGSQTLDDPHTWAYDVSRNEWRDMKPPSMPPTSKNDPELVYDSINHVVLAILKVTTGEGDAAKHEAQTWAFDAGVNKWTRMNPLDEPDGAGNRTRNLIFAPKLNLAILENCTSRPREQQIWTYRYAKNLASYEPPKATPPEFPAIVEDLVVSVLANNRVEIHWTPPPQTEPGNVNTAGTKPIGYHVERAVVEVWSDDQLVRLKQTTAPLASPSVGAIRRISSFRQLTDEPIRDTSFLDDSVDLKTPISINDESLYDSRLHADHLDPSGRPYRLAVFAYRVRTVDDAGRAGGPSPVAFTIPSSPQQLFSREDATTCRLKWADNHEKGLVGYRVYRMDGRWTKDPVSRLSPEPQEQTTFADTLAGKQSRRYYVVAVDVLGQEGFPSAPVWFQREWKAYYLPFIDEWHQ